MAIPRRQGGGGQHRWSAPALKVTVPVGVPENCGPTGGGQGDGGLTAVGDAGRGQAMVAVVVEPWSR